ncbi:enoyl-CoA hydratase/isomerase family protein [Mucilaginibacter lutimaris]|uniref:Enoyl-CoA hydratase/isomerase family protein n=1 Tax=Mucilaginibacter lutimaris TaxID=931629 RepID=A0ABW2ZLA9_9SPHI
MDTIQIAIKEKLATITLNRGRANSINLEMIAELNLAIKNLGADASVDGLIITGKEGFFSAGIDLIEAYNYNEIQGRELWTEFLTLQANLVAFPKPFVAAIGGHSPAGGCVMALCTDYRVMASGKFIIGLNEIPVGIIVPEVIFNLYAFWIGHRKAYQYLLEGKLLTVDEALANCLVDEVCEPAELLAVAENKVRLYMKQNAVTWSQSKQNMRAKLMEQFNADLSASLDTMLKQWWAPETRKGLQLMIENLKSASNK